MYIVRGRNAYVVIDSQELHRHEMNAAVFIKCNKICDESHLKKFADFDVAEDHGFICGSVSVRRVVCHILPSKVVAVFINAMLHLTLGIGY
ncbi:MAG: hypothetical protein WBQ25_07170 [Nitrososphaeraceae archaeon]